MAPHLLLVSRTDARRQLGVARHRVGPTPHRLWHHGMGIFGPVRHAAEGRDAAVATAERHEIRREKIMNERDLMEWLSKEDESTLGECDGFLLRRLYFKGFVDIRPIKGMAEAYSRVSLTEAGWAELKKEPTP
jgi:hypothetical protein